MKKLVFTFLVFALLIVGCGKTETNNESVANTDNEIESIAQEDNSATHIVTIQDSDGTVLKTVEVENGGSVSTDDIEIVDVNNFIGWLGNTEKVYSDRTITASYSNDPQGFSFIGNRVTASAGEEVTITVYVRDNPGIAGAMLSISYDENTLKLKSAKSGDAFSPLSFTPANVLQSGCNFLWDSVNIAEENVKDGAMLVLTFEVSNSADAGSYQVVLTSTEGDVINNNLESVNPEIKNGEIIIK